MILIDGEIGWDTTDKSFQDQLNNESGDVEIQVSSGGGSVFHGINIFNAMRAYNKGEITVVITSLAASIAGYLALAADKVKAYDNAVFMLHNASVVAWGDHRALRKKADIVNGLSGIIAKAYIAKTGKSEAEIQQLMDDETFLYGAEMLEHGFIDELITSEEEKPKEQAVALASETFTACLKSANDRITENDYVQAAAILKTEEPKPSITEKESVRKEDEATKNTSKVNAIKARLTLKERLHD